MNFIVNCNHLYKYVYNKATITTFTQCLLLIKMQCFFIIIIFNYFLKSSSLGHRRFPADSKNVFCLCHNMR